MSNLEIEALDAPLGAMVRGFDPGRALEPDERREIRRALADHLVLIFRGQPQPTEDQLIRFASSFGELILGSEWFHDSGKRPEILPVTNAVDAEGVPVGTGGAGPLEWHADYSYAARPAKESFLEAVELPADSPRTHFCSQYAALESLPPEIVERLRGLRAHHSITTYYESPKNSEGAELGTGFEAKKRRDEQLGIERPEIPEAEHPVVFRHPDTGREILYVSRGITKQILGLSKAESSALLKELHEHSTRPENVYTHEWEVGDLIVFDTLGALHRRDAWDGREVRRMRQLSTAC